MLPYCFKYLLVFLLVVLPVNVVKINVNTDLRVAWRSGVEETFKANPDALALYKIFPPAIRKVQDVVERWINICGSVNKI